MESLKTEIEEKAEEINEALNQIESEILESKISKNSIEKNIEDLQLKIDERFTFIKVSLKCKI